MNKPILPSNAAWRDAAGKQLPTEFWRWFRDLSAYVDRPDTTTPPPEPVEPDLSDYSIIGMGSVFSIGSLADKSVILQLVNDQDSPAPSYYYGTDAAGAKGFSILAISALADVDLTAIADGYALVWDSTAGKWIAGQVAANSMLPIVTGEIDGGQPVFVIGPDVSLIYGAVP